MYGIAFLNQLLVILFQAGLLIVGIFYTLYARRQWEAIRDTLVETQRGYGIAKEAADSARNIDRPWLMLDGLLNPELVAVPEAGTTPPAVIAAYSYKNYGRTPAFIVETAAKFIQIADINTLPSLPDYSDDAATNVLKQGVEIPLVPDARTNGMFTPLSPHVLLHQPDIDKINREEIRLYAFGFVRYRDVFNRTHETRWGYAFAVPHGGSMYRGWEMAGPPAYNRHD